MNHEYSADYASTQIARSKNVIRRIVRNFYLNDIIRHVKGKSIDFGCGAGDLLIKLPSGSMGLEVNSHAVDYCRSRNLQALLYAPEADGYEFSQLSAGVYTTFLMTHVLEHMENSDMVLKKIIHSCARLGIQRIILTLPCEKGFSFDETHKTFVNYQYLSDKELLATEFYNETRSYYFPVNLKFLGSYYTFHELRVILDKKN